jgi:TPR repeat protein
MSNIGTLYRDGDGVPQDFAQALQWFHKAAALMRFAAIGTAATGLMIVIFLMGMALAITPLIHAPAPAARPQKTATALPTPANPSSPA